MSPVGLFVGIASLDVIHRVDTIPYPNEKISSRDQMIVSGGCATNAAIAYSALGGRARLVAPIGSSVVGVIISDELHACGVKTYDAALGEQQEPCIASILVNASSGDRAIISSKGANICVTTPTAVTTASLSRSNVVLWDGYYSAIGLPALWAARKRDTPTVLDGDSWKPEIQEALPYIDHAVCSADFYPPGCANSSDVEKYLFSAGVKTVVITDGQNPIRWRTATKASGSVPVDQVEVVDTLAAGDIFHGAFCRAVADGKHISSLSLWIEYASRVATNSVRFFGPRAWIGKPLFVPEKT